MRTFGSTEDYIKHIELKLELAQEITDETDREIIEIHRNHSDQLFTGMPDTEYSTKPILAGFNVFGNLNKFGGESYTFINQTGRDFFIGTKEKKADLKWVTVKTPKGNRNLFIIEGGYAAIRAAEGRQIALVDLRRTGILERDYRSSLTRTEEGWISGVRRKENVGKLKGAKDRYGEKMKVSQDIINDSNRKLALVFITLVAS